MPLRAGWSLSSHSIILELLSRVAHSVVLIGYVDMSYKAYKV